MLKYTIIKLNLPISYKYIFYQTHRCIYTVTTKNILNTESGNLEMSQCLQCTSRNKTYCDKGRINNMKFFSNSLLIAWISHENKICFNHQLPPPHPHNNKKTDVTSHPYLRPHDGHLPTEASHLHPKVVVMVVISQAHAHNA